MINIKCSGSVFDGREQEYVLDCLARSWVTQGAYVRRFEEEFAALCEVKHAVACSSGTAALHLAMLALEMRRGDAVVVPAMTYVATANAARYCGADVHFCDIDRSSWVADPAEMRRGVLNASSQVSENGIVVPVPVHLFDAMAPITEDASIVDSAQAVGVATGHQLGWLATFSFYGSKVIACGEGGMVVTNNDEMAAKMRLYRGQGARYTGQYHHDVVGFNYRMTDLQAALGLAQLQRLPELLAKRREVCDRYRSNLSNSEEVTLQGGKRASGWMTAVLLPRDRPREIVAEKLVDSGIETRPFFEPLPSLPMYGGDRRGDAWPVAYEVAKRGICLPTHATLTDRDVDYVCDKLLEAIK